MLAPPRNTIHSLHLRKNSTVERHDLGADDKNGSLVIDSEAIDDDDD